MGTFCALLVDTDGFGVIFAVQAIETGEKP
jgi:hypothetical protein